MLLTDARKVRHWCEKGQKKKKYTAIQLECLKEEIKNWFVGVKLLLIRSKIFQSNYTCTSCEFSWGGERGTRLP